MNVHVLDCTLSQGIKTECNHVFLHNLCNVGNLLVEVAEIPHNPKTIIRPSQIIDMNNIDDQRNDKVYSILLDVDDFEKIDFPSSADELINVVRLLFGKDRIDSAKEASVRLKECGYSVYLCPKDSLSYSDIEWVKMIKKLKGSFPDAIYVYDESKRDEKTEDIYNKLFLLLNNNLNENVRLGLHVKDKFSTCFGMIQNICSHKMTRDVIVDASMLGLGDGNGYPNTELILENMNFDYNERYLFDSMEMMWPFLTNSVSWSYSPLSFLSAKTMVDTEYFSYYLTKGLHLNEMKKVVELIDDNRFKCKFNKDYANNILEAWNNRTTYLFM